MRCGSVDFGDTVITSEKSPSILL